jgi:hypothetical protein
MDAIAWLTRQSAAWAATPFLPSSKRRNGADRRLLMLTPRDPYNSTMQSFSPFRT